MRNKYIIFFLTVVILIIIGFMNMYLSNVSPKDRVKTFEECVNANNLVLGDYPHRQCRTPNNKIFNEQISPVKKSKTTSPNK